MSISKSGVKAQQKALDIISNNIANVSTQGFKKANINFQSLIQNDIRSHANLITNDIALSAGVNSFQGERSMINGTLYSGEQSMDLALTGEGYFGVANSDGELFLTRDGSFMIDNLGQIVNSNGDFLVVDGQSPVQIENPKDLSIDANGKIQTVNDNGESFDLGKISVYLPNNNRNLEAMGNNYFRAPEEGLELIEEGSLIQVNQLEMSNVELSREFTNMIIAQRAYDLNIRVSQANDEIKMITNQFS